MKQPTDVPLLFTFYFPDSVSCAHQGASRRFKKWSRAFDHWIASLQQDYRKDTLKHALLAWRRLVRQSGKIPWQLTSSDIDQHAAWLKQEGFAVSTINGSIGFFALFYQWCADHRVDSACPSGFNPAKGASRINLPRYTGVSLWSLEELDALFTLLQRDSSPLGKRDFAFFLARLSLGVSLKSLQRLTWGQVEQDATGTWVRWSRDGHRIRLPDQVWQAFMDYLTLSGRLDGMTTERYVFAPHVQPVFEGSGTQAEDWLEARPLSNSALISSLKLYGRQLGIPEIKLTFIALRRTAIRLRMDHGESLVGMQAFLDTHEKMKSTKYRLSRLPGLPHSDLLQSHLKEADTTLPVRGTKPFQGGESTTHGFYSHRQDIQAVKAVMAENIRGMDQEIACLRELMRLLLEREGDEAKTIEAYSQAAQRLIQLISAARSGNKGEVDTWVEENLRMLDKIAAQLGYPPVSSSIRQEALGLSATGEDAAVPLTEEIATIRLLLRNLYTRATAACQDDELMHLLNLYGKGCIRLAKLEKLCGGEQDALARYLQNAIDKAIREVAQEFPAIRNDKQDIEPGL